MRAALAGLTTRGRCLIAAGAALLVCAVLLGQRDLLRAAVFLLALPLTAVVVVARTRYRLACSRYLDPPRVEVDRVSTVRLRLDNVGRLASGVLLMEDTLPYVLGGRPRFVLDRVEPKGLREVRYPVRSEARGRFRVGPLAIRLTDPFSLVELTRSFSSSDELVVTPVVSVLPQINLGGDWSTGGEAVSRAVSMTGHDDAATREYREGDDLRKVHWRSTARVGELMVRREEQPFTSRATLLLDNRQSAHRGQGPGASLEWSVSAMASIGVALLRSGFSLRLLGCTADELVPAGLPTTEGTLLEALAGVTSDANEGLAQATEQLRRTGVDGLFVAVLGSLEPADADQLSRLRHGTATCIAVLVDTPTWLSGPQDDTGHRAAVGLLRSSGWRVLPVRHGTTLASVWPQAATRQGRAEALT
jgi:uncharacterized protein (DUF58 family)